MIYQLYFSPTGGTKKVADCVCSGWTKETRCIDLSDSRTDFSQYHFQPEDLCLVAAPVFGGRVPTPATARLAKMQGGGAKAVLLCVYGNRAIDDALLELSDVLTKQGFTCTAAISAVAEHSIMHQFGAGRPDAQDKQELEAFAVQIQKQLERTDKQPGVQVPGNRPYRPYGGIPLKPKAGKTCTKCGLCAIKCPVQAIDRDDPRQTDPAICISCMRCIAACPPKARKLNPMMVAASIQKLKKACTERKENTLFL